MIAVFKTSVHSADEVQLLSPALSEICRPNASWNFDLEDCDHILRIDTGDLGDISFQCREIVRAHGFVCEGLE